MTLFGAMQAVVCEAARVERQTSKLPIAWTKVRWQWLGAVPVLSLAILVIGAR